MLPCEFDHLVALSQSDDPRTALWSASERFARSYRLPTAPISAEFDDAGQAVAFIDPSRTLFAGPLPGPSP